MCVCPTDSKSKVLCLLQYMCTYVYVLYCVLFYWSLLCSRKENFYVIHRQLRSCPDGISLLLPLEEVCREARLEVCTLQAFNCHPERQKAAVGLMQSVTVTDFMVPNRLRYHVFVDTCQTA